MLRAIELMKSSHRYSKSWFNVIEVHVFVSNNQIKYEITEKISETLSFTTFWSEYVRFTEEYKAKTDMPYL